jgi:hypothetical protein
VKIGQLLDQMLDMRGMCRRFADRIVCSDAKYRSGKDPNEGEHFGDPSLRRMGSRGGMYWTFSIGLRQLEIRVVHRRLGNIMAAQP